jgi:hypothetical protein
MKRFRIKEVMYRKRDIIKEVHVAKVYYLVQVRIFFFWFTEESFETLEEAKSYIAAEKKVELYTTKIHNMKNIFVFLLLLTCCSGSPKPLQTSELCTVVAEKGRCILYLCRSKGRIIHWSVCTSSAYSSSVTAL